MSSIHFTAIVLAGTRSEGDHLAAQEDVPVKAMIDVAGQHMIQHVLSTLQNSRIVDEIIICGPKDVLGDYGYECVSPEQSPSLSVLKTLEQIDPEKPVLITTADHPLLRYRTLDTFLEHSLEAPCDATVGLVPVDIIYKAYPQSQRTGLKFWGGHYSGSNLFTLMNMPARNLPAFWRKMEAYRKKPMRIAKELGFVTSLLYLLNILTLDAALNKIGKKTGVRIKPVFLNDPDAAVDVDKPSDLELVRAIFKKQRLN